MTTVFNCSMLGKYSSCVGKARGFCMHVFLVVKNLPVQSAPFPKYPLLHLQSYEPAVFVQTAFTLHLFMPVEHSSMSEIFKILM